MIHFVREQPLEFLGRGGGNEGISRIKIAKQNKTRVIT
jgi:hypothetical protein